ncbi:MAG: NAD-dependent epimerase [Bacteriovoracaceae bacterium]|nr:NAD-dependent epimerase [Bacteriovoracaceae bacterium]
MKVLVTGAAGFIGYFTVKRLLGLGYEVIGIDNINDYYEPKLKWGRLWDLGIYEGSIKSNKYSNFSFFKFDLSEELAILELFKRERFDFVIHLAAQAGVRYSIESPLTYIKSNAEGFLHILEGCRHNKVGHLIYASSSSVYGKNSKIPFSVEDPVDHPVSLYAATKRANELMAHTYSHLYGVPTTGLRFFTVYGPWGRPDMAPFLFTDAIFNDRPIKVFNEGDMERDFTYVEDIVEAMVKLLDKVPAGGGSCNKPNTSTAPFRLFNIGNSAPVQLMEFIQTLESAIGKEAQKEFLPMQDGDVQRTYANVEDLYDLIKFRPKTSLKDGIEKFVSWFENHYNADAPKGE